MFGRYKPQNFEGQNAPWVHNTKYSELMSVADNEEEDGDIHMDIDEVPPLVADPDCEDIELIDIEDGEDDIENNEDENADE